MLNNTVSDRSRTSYQIKKQKRYSRFLLHFLSVFVALLATADRSPGSLPESRQFEFWPRNPTFAPDRINEHFLLSRISP